MIDPETRVRGYRVSGDTGFLAPYHDGRKAFAAAREHFQARWTPARVKKMRPHSRLVHFL